MANNNVNFLYASGQICMDGGRLRELGRFIPQGFSDVEKRRTKHCRVEKCREIFGSAGYRCIERFQEGKPRCDIVGPIIAISAPPLRTKAAAGQLSIKVIIII